MKVSLIGMGPGNPDLLTGEARKAIDRAELLIGAPRLLQPFRESGKPCREAVSAPDVRKILEGEPAAEAAVLLSGDTGFYSGARRLLSVLRQAGMEPVVYSGISSLQYLCARLEVAWDDVHPASAHGRPCDPVELVSRYGRVFFLTGERPEQSPRGLCAALAAGGYGDAPAWVGSRLSYPDEQIVGGSVEQLARQEFPSPSVLLVQGEPDIPPAGAFGIPDDGFVRGDVPMTKEEVRAAALSRLRVAPGGAYWDVGAGTGSVTVGMAVLARQRGHVWAVEREPEACALIRQNAGKYRAGNVTVVEGEAPAALKNLPAPDGMFVGGSGGYLREILQAALEKNPRMRVVIAAVTLETLSQAAAALEELAFTGVEVSQITVARARQAGKYHLMAGQNPVFLLSGEGNP